MAAVQRLVEEQVSECSLANDPLLSLKVARTGRS